MEGFRNTESKESHIDKRIEDLATREGMNPEDIISDICTFAELYESDADAGAYLAEVAEKIGISFAELLEYAQN